MSKELKDLQNMADICYGINETDVLSSKDAMKLISEKGIALINSKEKQKMKISFDFDSTLDTEEMQLLATKCIRQGIEVFVTTSRSKVLNKKLVDNDDLYVVTDMLGIPRENIIFTQHKDKYSFVKDYDVHFDDDIEEIFLINQHPGKCLGFLYEEKHNNGLIEY